jgi:N-ethylmaleimide reductase
MHTFDTTIQLANMRRGELDPSALYGTLVTELATRSLAYIHVVETGDRATTEVIRSAWPGTLVLNTHPSPDAFPATPTAAAAALASGLADAVSLATMWLANPELDARIRAGGPYNEPDPATFYGGDHRGYTDYPALSTTATTRETTK